MLRHRPAAALRGLARWLHLDDDDGAGVVQPAVQQEQRDPARARHADRREWHLRRLVERSDVVHRSATGGAEPRRRRARADRRERGTVERHQRGRQPRRAVVHGGWHEHQRGVGQRRRGSPGRRHAYLPHRAHRAAVDARRRRGRGQCRRRLDGIDDGRVSGRGARHGDGGRGRGRTRRRAPAGGFQPVRDAAPPRRRRVDLPRRDVARAGGRACRRDRDAAAPRRLRPVRDGRTASMGQHGDDARRRLSRHRGLRRRSRHAADPESVAAQRARERRRLLPRRTRRRRHLRWRRVDRFGNRPRARPRTVATFRVGAVRAAQSPDRERHDLRARSPGDRAAARRERRRRGGSLRELQQPRDPVGRVARVSTRLREEARWRILRLDRRSTRQRAQDVTGDHAGLSRRIAAQRHRAGSLARRAQHPHVRLRPARAEHRRAPEHWSDRLVRPAGELRAGHARVSASRGRILQRHADGAWRRHGSGAAAPRVDPARGGRIRRRRGVDYRQSDGLRGRCARAPVVRSSRTIPRLCGQRAERGAGRDRDASRFLLDTDAEGSHAPERRTALSRRIPDLAVERERRLEPHAAPLHESSQHAPGRGARGSAGDRRALRLAARRGRGARRGALRAAVVELSTNVGVWVRALQA